MVLQSNAVSDLGKKTLIVPFSSQKLDKVYPYELLIEATAKNGLERDSKLKFDQVRVIDKSRIMEARGTLEEEYNEEVLGCLDVIFDRWGDYR